MAQKSLAPRARCLSVYCRFSLALVLSLASWPVAAQDRDQDRDRAAAERAFAEGARLWKEGTAASRLLTIEKYQEALALWRVVGDRKGEARAIEQIGNAYNGLGDYRKALGYWEQAAPLKRALEDHQGEALVLVNIGSAYIRLGEKERAMDRLTQALPLARATGELRTEARALAYISNIYSSFGDKQRALELSQRSLLIRRELGDRPGEA